MNELIEKIIEHSGVKGMKWGVRKSKVTKQGPSDDAKKAHKSFVKAKTSGSQALSNKELSDLNNRLNLEQNYSRLSYNPSKLKKGLDAVSGLVKTGKTVDEAIQFANTPTGKAIKASLTVKKAARVVT